MGIPISAEAMKNIGFDVAKPDRHVNRTVGCFGLVKFHRWSESYIDLKGKRKVRFIEFKEPPKGYSYPEVDESKCMEVIEAMENFANVIGVKVTFLDNAIWLLCAKSGLHVSNEQLVKLGVSCVNRYYSIVCNY